MADGGCDWNAGVPACNIAASAMSAHGVGWTIAFVLRGAEGFSSDRSLITLQPHAYKHSAPAELRHVRFPMATNIPLLRSSDTVLLCGWNGRVAADTGASIVE